MINWLQVSLRRKKRRTVKNIFQDLLSQHIVFCQINLNNLFSSDNIPVQF